MKPLLDRARIMQNCYIVNDIEEACHRFHKLFGIGPFLVGRSPIENVTYRGQPSEPLDFSRSFVQSGDLNIEFIQPHSTAPNAFTDVFPNGEEGLHHVAIFASDYDAECSAFVEAGYPIANELTLLPDCRVSFIDTCEALGHMVELYEEHPYLRAVYQNTREAAENWDGKELIRQV